MRYYNKSGEAYNGRDIVVNGVRIVNPSTEQLTGAGYAPVPDNPVQPDPSAEALAALQEGDYRIIKSMEEFLVQFAEELKRLGITLPYDIAALHAERNHLRDVVNGNNDATP